LYKRTLTLCPYRLLEAVNSMQQPSTEDQLMVVREAPHLLKLGKESSSPSNEEEMLLAYHETNKIKLAKTYFDCKEYDRAAHVLKDCHSWKATFIKLYSMYISGDKRKEEESDGILGQNNSNNNFYCNKNIPVIVKELETLEHPNLNSNSHLLCLYGIVLLENKNSTKGQEVLFKSLVLNPFNWSCWLELLSSFTSFSEATVYLSKFHKALQNAFEYKIMLLFFRLTVNQVFFQSSEEINSDLATLSAIFPCFSYLNAQKALIAYNMLDYNNAEILFDQILLSDPLRLDDLDTYSNILYVMEKDSKLSFLAQFASKIDKFRPETCCIVANYYSLKFEHEKAIMYYKRALTLNKNCLSAWTLMGHEFVELKNSHAAIESYRRAVDTNNKDFRAWYGLGQAYEVLDMHLYSLYYYQRACSLKPLDKRMWQAIGNCYEKLGETKESVKCYQKALKISTVVDTQLLYKIGTLYEVLNDIKTTYNYMKLCFEEEYNQEVTEDTSKAKLWLARYESQQGNWSFTYKLASDISYGNSNIIEEARALAREARLKLDR